MGKFAIHKEGDLVRILPPDAPRRVYYQRKGESRTTNHWGQRKLLLSEIEFLMLYGHLNSVVLYAGAAPGVKTRFLAELFPEHKFILVDPAPFRCEEVKDRIEIHQEFFTDDVARSYRDVEPLFICDIRTADPNCMEEEEVEETVMSDQRMQMKWHLLMHAKASMLKFRLPWGKGTTSYLDGKVFLPVWGRQTTTETRLIVEGRDLKDWDNTEYEEQLFHFNTVTRVSYYEHDVEGVRGLCHCYDCAAEVAVVKQYLTTCGKFKEKDVAAEELAEAVADMMDKITSECSTKRDLGTIVGHGQKWFKAQRYDIDAGVIVNASSDAIEQAHRRKSTDYTRKERGRVDNSDLLDIE